MSGLLVIPMFLPTLYRRSLAGRMVKPRWADGNPILKEWLTGGWSRRGRKAREEVEQPAGGAFGDRSEGQAMMRADPEAFEGGAVLRRAVALVLVEVVAGTGVIER